MSKDRPVANKSKNKKETLMQSLVFLHWAASITDVLHPN